MFNPGAKAEELETGEGGQTPAMTGFLPDSQADPEQKKGKWMTNTSIQLVFPELPLLIK